MNMLTCSGNKHTIGMTRYTPDITNARTCKQTMHDVTHLSGNTASILTFPLPNPDQNIVFPASDISSRIKNNFRSSRFDFRAGVLAAGVKDTGSIHTDRNDRVLQNNFLMSSYLESISRSENVS